MGNHDAQRNRLARTPDGGGGTTGRGEGAGGGAGVSSAPGTTTAVLEEPGSHKTVTEGWLMGVDDPLTSHVKAITLVPHTNTSSFPIQVKMFLYWNFMVCIISFVNRTWPPKQINPPIYEIFLHQLARVALIICCFASAIQS